MKQPRILLLDEATSALDKVNEGIVQEAIDRYRKINPVTTIVIAHRLSTIRDADKILVLVNGNLQEQGNHEQILQQFPEGTYAQFCAKQAAAESNVATDEKLDSAARMAEDEIMPEEPKEEEKTGGVKRTRTKTIKDSSGRTKTITQDADVAEKLNEADEMDEAREKQVEESLKELREKSDFVKVMAYNNPKMIIPVGCLLVGAAGFCQPLFGWVFSNF